jgi:hypothetical protein
MVDDGKPVVIAIGNLHTQSSEQLLSAGLLQSLADEHGADGYGKPYSSKDLRVAFIDVQVFDGEAGNKCRKDFPVIRLDENEDVLRSAGWDRLYSINETRLFWVSPDHLLHPFKGNSAEALYAEVSSWNTRLRPTEDPDLRLLDAVVSAPEQAEIRVQNFSKIPMQGIEILVMKDGQELTRTKYNACIASLEDALIPVMIPGGTNARLTIVAKAAGDTNDLNNRWSGALRNDDVIIAGSFGR